VLRLGRRNVATAVRPHAIEQVMGEPAAAEPIRVFVGLESAPTETQRVAWPWPSWSAPGRSTGSC
jgi:uncharacterized membrane protein